MPEISRFFGIIILMYWSEHNPPHFHVRYGAEKAIIDIKSLKLIQGKLSLKALKIVLEWAKIYQTELLKNWDLCQKNLVPQKIKPII